MARLSKKKKCVVIVLLAALLAVVFGFAFYSHQEKQERVGLNTEETMALYMERWQDQEYLAMLNMWHLSTFLKIYGMGLVKISEFGDEVVTEVVSIEKSSSWDDLKFDYEVYDHTACTVRYQVLYQGKYYEHMSNYIMVQLKEGGIWYIDAIGKG